MSSGRLLIRFRQKIHPKSGNERLRLVVTHSRLFEGVRRHWAIIGTAVLVVLAAVFLTFRLHLEDKAEVLSEFGNHQLAHSQHLAHQIRFFFQARSQELLALSLLVSRESGAFKEKKEEMQRYSQMMEFVKAVTVYNEKGNVTYATNGHSIRLDGRDREFLSWAKRAENKGKVLGLPLAQPDSFMVLLVVPLYPDSLEASPRKRNGKFAGVLTLTVDLEDFLSHQFQFLGFNKNQHEVWILDGSGKLLYPSKHREMVQRNIHQRDETCRECHASLDYVDKILKDKQGTVVYELKNFPKKIATFAPMDFEETSWIVVLNSSYDEVAGYIKKSLREHLALLGVVVFASILGTVSIIRIDRLKVRAEAEVKHFQEKRALEDKVRQSEKQLRYLSSQLLTAQETERRRISREIHDELGQALSVIKLRLSFVEKKLREDQTAAKEECRAISQYINQVIENVRRLSRDLTPSILEDAGLLAAIRWLITNFNRNHKIKMILDVGDIDQWFSQDAQIMIYRILQEALTNIGRHARARNASVVIRKDEDDVSFCVEDDGIGFDVFRATTVNPDERGLGLAIIEERARMLGGSLEIWSEKGKGTRISFHVPLKKEGST